MQEWCMIILNIMLNFAVSEEHGVWRVPFFQVASSSKSLLRGHKVLKKIIPIIIGHNRLSRTQQIKKNKTFLKKNKVILIYF